MRKLRPSQNIAQRVTDELLVYLETERASLEPEAEPLLGELEALVAAGGKRLRPRFCYWGFRAAGGSDGQPIVRTGAALELLHTMALIQDDVMDASSTRRSRASTFRTLSEISSGAEHRGDPARFGASAAILTGLLGFVLADRLFTIAGFEPHAMHRASERYDRMRARAIAGQYLDLLAAHRGEADEPTARRIAALKSGSYTVSDPLAIGALLASGDDPLIDLLEAYGAPLGEAFQLRDDVLGTFGDPEVTGKDRDSDIREGKQTVLLAKTRARANEQQGCLLDAEVGNRDVAPEDADRIRDIMVATGALDETNRLIDELAEDAKLALEGHLDEKVTRALHELADEATVRYA